MGQETASGRPGGTDVPEAVLEDLLAVPRRRALLRHLATADAPMALTDLAAVLCRNDAGGPGTEQCSAHESVRTALFQEDLPKLTATGVVEYDSMRGTVALRDERLAERV